MENKREDIEIEKYSPEELEKALLFLDGRIEIKDVTDIFKTEDEKEKISEIERRCAPENSAEFDPDAILKILEELYLGIAKHIDKKDFGKLATVETDISTLVKMMIDHPEYYGGSFTNEEILILLSTQRRNMKAINALINEPVGQYIRALNYTDAEKNAVSMYTGEMQYRATEDDDQITASYMYELYNMLFYPGLKNEESRLFDEEKAPPSQILSAMNSLLSFSRNFYKAIYKSSRKLPEELILNRVDRVSTIEKMEETGSVASNFSTTLGRPNTIFSKRHTALVEGTCHRGAVAGDFAEILRGLYSYKDEKELLIAPGAKVTIEDLDLSEEDKEFAKYDADKVDRKVRMDFYADSSFIDPLTPEEKEEKGNLEKYLLNPENSEKAAMFIRELVLIRANNSTPLELEKGKKHSKRVTTPTITFEEAMAKINPDTVEKYLEFKNKFTRYYNLMTREVAMEVESSIERAEQNYRRGEYESTQELLRYGELNPRKERFVRTGIKLRDDDKKEIMIREEELRELATKERLDTIKESVDTFSKVVGENELKIGQDIDHEEGK